MLHSISGLDSCKVDAPVKILAIHMRQRDFEWLELKSAGRASFSCRSKPECHDDLTWDFRSFTTSEITSKQHGVMKSETKDKTNCHFSIFSMPVLKRCIAREKNLNALHGKLLNPAVLGLASAPFLLR